MKTRKEPMPDRHNDMALVKNKLLHFLRRIGGQMTQIFLY